MDIIETQVRTSKKYTELKMLERIRELIQLRFELLQRCGFKVTRRKGGYEVNLSDPSLSEG